MKVADRERCAGCSRRAHVAREARSGGRRREQALTAATMPERAGVAMGAIIVKMDAGESSRPDYIDTPGPRNQLEGSVP